MMLQFTVELFQSCSKLKKAGQNEDVKTANFLELILSYINVIILMFILVIYAPNIMKKKTKLIQA